MGQEDPRAAAPPAQGYGGYPPPAPAQQFAYPPPQGYPYGAGAPQAYPPGAGYPPGAWGQQPQGQQYYQAPPPGQAYYAGAQPQHLPARPPAAKPQPNYAAFDVEAQQAAAAAAAFAEAKVRSQFVRKVFLLVFLQICVTVGVACVFMFVEPVKNYVRPGGPGQWLFIVMWIVSLVALIALMCSTTLRRKHPWNLLALFGFTLIFSVLVGVICSYWNVEVVLVALAVTAAAVAGLTLVAVFGKFDMTKRGHILFMAGMVVFMVVLVTMIVGFFYVNKWWYLALSVVIALLFSAYLVYDIQLVMGGKQHAISPDEYVFASLQIYLDVVQIFLAILNIVGIASSN